MGDSPKSKDPSPSKDTKFGKMGANKARKKKEPKVELTEEEKAAKKIADRAKFVKNYCTLLEFRNKDGTVTEKLLEGERFETYTELQRALARITPRSMKVFMCMSMTDGKVLTAETFKNENCYRIKEMPNAKIDATAKSKFKPQVEVRCPALALARPLLPCWPFAHALTPLPPLFYFLLLPPAAGAVGVLRLPRRCARRLGGPHRGGEEKEGGHRQGAERAREERRGGGQNDGASNGGRSG